MTLKKEPTTTSIPTILRALRASRDISQADLAQRAGIQQKMISAYENGHSMPSLETAKRLADALGVSVEVFFGDSIQVIHQSRRPDSPLTL